MKQNKIKTTDLINVESVQKTKKRIQGIVQTSIIKPNGKIMDVDNNLVLIGGREFLAQKLSDTVSSIYTKEILGNLNEFSIRYFGIGSGGATQTQFSSKIGPYENDKDLIQAHQISPSNDSSNNYSFINSGYLKKVNSVNILSEDHKLSVNGNTINLKANTTIKFTMEIKSNEIPNRPFCFNEAALYAVDMELDNKEIPKGVTSNDKFNAQKITFARFTTSNKNLEDGDTLLIEWFILV